MYKIISSKEFLKKFNKIFDSNEIEKFENFKDRLKENAYLGDQLRVPFLREFKTKKGKRAYFIVYESSKIIFFVACSNKKDQEALVDEIYQNLKEYKEKFNV